jgi:serine/threonine protein phosphatase 1
MSTRTFAIGDIHGDLAALEALLARLPALEAEDTVVFLGDYVDRGPGSKEAVARVRQLAADTSARTVMLRGNHEDKWISCFESPDPSFLLPVGNGCLATFRSFTGRAAPDTSADGYDPEEMKAFLDVCAWLPRDVHDWMAGLPLWYEDEHAIYVHAGLEGEGTEWKHPRDSAPKPLMWMREPDFFTGYHGKRLIFGHTTVDELPLDHLGRVWRLFDDPKDVWRRGDLIGIDTGAGKGGFLSAVELPAGRVYESR